MKNPLCRFLPLNTLRNATKNQLSKVEANNNYLIDTRYRLQVIRLNEWNAVKDLEVIQLVNGKEVPLKLADLLAGKQISKTFKSAYLDKGVRHQIKWKYPYMILDLVKFWVQLMLIKRIKAAL